LATQLEIQLSAAKKYNTHITFIAIAASSASQPSQMQQPTRIKVI